MRRSASSISPSRRLAWSERVAAVSRSELAVPRSAGSSPEPSPRQRSTPASAWRSATWSSSSSRSSRRVSSRVFCCVLVSFLGSHRGALRPSWAAGGRRKVAVADDPGRARPPPRAVGSRVAAPPRGAERDDEDAARPTRPPRASRDGGSRRWSGRAHHLRSARTRSPPRGAETGTAPARHAGRPGRPGGSERAGEAADGRPPTRVGPRRHGVVPRDRGTPCRPGWTAPTRGTER
jgi:hypothetical protein